MLSSDEIDNIRKELRQTLDADSLDFDKIIKLSNVLSQNDPDHVRFTVDAGHVSRLGRELVARQETAVSELVKNAYDADATKVSLVFVDADAPGGRLVISDNGHGMSRDQLIDGFMRIASSDKISNPLSPIYGRRRAGRKGIGRFASQRLGNTLSVETQVQGEDAALRVEIDWLRFTSGFDLARIANRIEMIAPTSSAGTSLSIGGLVDGWSDSELKRIYRYLTDLLQPFPLGERQGENRQDPGFQLSIARKVGGEIIPVATDATMIYSHALAVIDADVDGEGFGSWSVRSSIIELDDQNIKIGLGDTESSVPFKLLRNVHMRAYYFIYNSGYLPRNLNGFIRDLASTHGGVRLYRNGFRVPPYGERIRLDDWLKLDDSSGRRELLPPHANINFFGFVQLTDPEGKQFEETSSREGLIQNEAFSELIDFCHRTLIAAVTRVAYVRNKKVTPGQRDWKSKSTNSNVIRETASEIASAAVKLGSEPGQKSSGASNDGKDGQSSSQTLSGLLAVAVNRLNQAADEQDEQEELRDRLLEELGFLRVLASLGLTIGEFTHEIYHLLPAMRLEASYLVRELGNDTECRIRAERLSGYLDLFRNFTAYFDDAIRSNEERDLRPQELGRVLRGFYSSINKTAARSGIVLHEPVIEDYDLFSCAMHPSEWISILFNFYTNSKKAIHRIRGDGQILIHAGRGQNTIFIQFSDNGDGIPSENRARIFDAFFTTTSSASSTGAPVDDARGMGLGLKIVRDIVSAYGGSIELASPPEGYNTSFRVEVKAASDDEMEQYEL